ncbi:putative Auxin response factor [Hibiscus syriacus]|uniref:Auxin response factor n=1 Tax=Hibiscus syriacus TaxID=106335 RepID=A0A6A3AB14_HIBSY|nr:putative Auxin response factor [Hibiscus syriacus]
MEEDFVKYQTAPWVLCSLVLVLAWGIGLFMLLYVPVRRYILRKDNRSRKLFLTPNSIVYKKEKHVVLPSVADVVIEQGYLQFLFGVYSLRIENVGVRWPPDDDLHIQGMVNPSAFRKAVLTRLSNMSTEVFSRQVSANEDAPNLSIRSPSAWRSPLKHDAVPISGNLALLQKLEEVGNSVKRVQNLIEEQHSQASETAG